MEIDVCSHIVHILAKTVNRTTSRNCIPFPCLISRILRLKGVRPSANECPHSRLSPINGRTLQASMSHTKKTVKQEHHPPQGSSSSTSPSNDEKFNIIMVALQDLSTKISGLTQIMYSQHFRLDKQLTSLETQMDEIHRKLEENDN